MKITKRKNIHKDNIAYSIQSVDSDKIIYDIADLYTLYIMNDKDFGYNVSIEPKPVQINPLESDFIVPPRMGVFYPVEDTEQCVVQCDELLTQYFIEHLCMIDNVSIEDKEQKRKAYKICKGLVAISDLMEELIDDYRRYMVKGEPME